MSGGAMLYAPRPARVATDEHGRPLRVGEATVLAVREEWLVEDRWWTPRPIARHYFELALGDGRCEVVFRERDGWYSQRA